MTTAARSVRRIGARMEIGGCGLAQYQPEGIAILLRRVLRLAVCFAAVAIITFVAYRVLRVNAPTVGFAGGYGIFYNQFDRIGYGDHPRRRAFH